MLNVTIGDERRSYRNGVTYAEIAKTYQEKMEDEYDLRVYEEAKRQYEADPVTYTAKELGL